MKNKNWRSSGWCDVCQKHSYASRKIAKQVCRAPDHLGRHKSPYECPYQPNVFHVGDLARAVIQGHTSRADRYPRAA